MTDPGQKRRVVPQLAGFGYLAFAIGMLSGRTLGAWLFRTFSVRGTIMALSVLAGAVLATAIAVGNSVLGIIAFLCLGLGMSTVFPAIVSRMGTHRSMPTVVVSGYAGMLVGPGIVGGIAGLTSLPIALSLIAALCFVPGIGARVIGLGKGGPDAAGGNRENDSARSHLASPR